MCITVHPRSEMWRGQICLKNCSANITTPSPHITSVNAKHKAEVSFFKTQTLQDLNSSINIIKFN